MRFDEFSVSLGDDQAVLRFHPQLTVVGPLDASARAHLIATVLAGAAGDLEGGRLRMTDAQGEALVVTPDGVFNDDGTTAIPILGAVVPNRTRLRRTVVVEAADLGLPGGRPDHDTLVQLDATRAALAELDAPTAPAQADAGQSIVDRALRTELADLDQRLRQAAEADDRAAHHRAACRLADLRAEVQLIADLAATEESDRTLLTSAAELADLAQRRDAATSLAERARAAVRAATTILGEHAGAAAIVELPDEHETDPLIASFATAARTWQRQVIRVRTLERALADHTQPGMDAVVDRRVHLLAPLDQDVLWATHRRVRETEREFLAVTAARDTGDDIDPAVEAELDAAHIERVRAEELAATLWRPGILSTSVVAVCSLVSATVGVPLALACLAVTAALAVLLIVRPKRVVAKAMAEERRQLERVGATSYLGLHLRRLDEPSDRGAQQALADLARDRTLAMVAWKELVGHLEPAEADGIEEDIRNHATRFNAALRADRTKALTDDLAQASARRDEAREQLRTAAGQLQVQVDEAREEAATTATAHAALLHAIGVPAEGDVAEAIARHRVASLQRERVRQQSRPLAHAEAELVEVAATVERLAQPGWDGPPPVPPSAAAVSLLERRRAELQARVGPTEPAAIVEPAERAARRAQLEQQARQLQAALGPMADEPHEALAKRLLGRLARARTTGDGVGESLPVVLDDPLGRVAVDRRRDLLDMLLRVSERMQVIYLTDDPVVMGWARHHRDHEWLALLEPVSETA